MIRKLKNIFHLFIAVTSSIHFRFPGRKMIVIGVTGTSGKTTTASMIYHVLKSAGKKVSVITTVSAIINGVNFDTGFHVTSPSPFSLQKYLNLAYKGGSEYFVLEVTSHALDQYRVFGTNIKIAVITNISHEHIDYHKTLEKYRDAKAKILKVVQYAVLNADDASFDYLSNKTSGKVISFGIDKKADINLKNYPVKSRFVGKFQLYNFLAATGVANLLKIDKKNIISAIKSYPGIKGRWEELTLHKPFRVIIDFAHKPNALEEVLKAVRTITRRKLIVVFGCAGLRDHLKRPMMGKIAAKLADYVILTAEDPRTEDVRDIISEIAQGFSSNLISEADKKNKIKNLSVKTKGKYFWKIPDRQEAINFSIRRLAQKGDVILLCGKGHEKSMCYGKIEYPWDEIKAVEKAINGTVKTIQ